jgi:superfamily II DNA or RNA helicase
MRAHQAEVDAWAAAIARGETDVRDVLCAVTPGGGKSLLPVIAARRLLQAGIVDRVCWIVPRDTLRLQAEEAFADVQWRAELGHRISLRSAVNAPDPCRGLDGYVTSYQAVAAAPDLHLAEFVRHRYLLAVDELHHLPAVHDTDLGSAVADETGWSRAILPLLERARVRLLMSGTLERADGRPILWLPYGARDTKSGGRPFRRIDHAARGWAIVGYSRRQALAERAILPVTFGAMDGEAEWRPLPGSDAPSPEGPIALSAPPDVARYALYTALRTEYAEQLLREAFEACRAHRARRRRALGIEGKSAARGLGKLLVVASDQQVARGYATLLASWLPPDAREASIRTATSDVADAHESIAAFRLLPDPAILVTVAMAYEGMDAPEVTHVACLTHIRSRPWLEQMIARATRVDPDGGPWEDQAATVYHPDDLLFRRFRHAIETEQGNRARLARRGQGDLFEDETPDGVRGWGLGIEPLRSNATALAFRAVAPGPDFRAAEGGDGAVPDEGMPERPSQVERRLRERIGQMVAAQVVEDRGERVPGSEAGYHAYNAVLKRATGGKSRPEMGRAELEAAIGWLERNRISDHLDLIEGDARYRWAARRARETRGTAKAWIARAERRARGAGSAAP